MSVRSKGLLGMQVNEKTLVRRNDNRRTLFRKTEVGDRLGIQNFAEGN